MDDPAHAATAGTEALALAARRGEPGAFERWFDPERRAVWKLCFGFLADREEADDLVQDAMLHLFDHLAEWDPARPYRTWRNAVVANQCRDRLRRIGARTRAETGAAEARMPDTLPDPLDQAAGAEVFEIVRGALSLLSPREREVFVLRDLESVTTGDTAEVLGITEGSVRSLLTLARRRMRRLLGERAPGLVPGGEVGE